MLPCLSPGRLNNSTEILVSHKSRMQQLDFFVHCFALKRENEWDMQKKGFTKYTATFGVYFTLLDESLSLGAPNHVWSVIFITAVPPIEIIFWRKMHELITLAEDSARSVCRSRYTSKAAAASTVAIAKYCFCQVQDLWEVIQGLRGGGKCSGILRQCHLYVFLTTEEKYLCSEWLRREVRATVMWDCEEVREE